MTRRTVWIILLVSLAHAMVHTFELIYPAVEQSLGEAWNLGPSETGRIARVWALPFGLGAVAAGWLADRFGSRVVLIVYLLGCSAACFGVGFAGNLKTLLPAMFVMGSFASLYHPAGLSYISRVVEKRDLGLALGYHGIVGAVGIAGAPLLGGTLLMFISWQDAYLTLVVPGVLLALLMAWCLPEISKPSAVPSVSHDDAMPKSAAGSENWTGFAVICIVTMLFGLIYRGFVTFLPRYLGETSLFPDSVISRQSLGNYLACGVLVLGVFGQYTGGWLCGRFRLERLLLATMLLNIPFLILMGFADGVARLLLTSGYSVIHFLMQPVGNSLIAHYTPSHRRSLGYGINFLVAFGVGSFGAEFAGQLADRFGTQAIYPGLAILAGAGAVVGVVICYRASHETTA